MTQDQLIGWRYEAEADAAFRLAKDGYEIADEIRARGTEQE